MENLYELARIVMPSSEYIDYSNLFINKVEGECYIDGILQRVNIYKFNTWMNLFAAKKYYYYCDLGSVYLKLHVEGKYKVVVTGSNSNVAFNRIDDILSDIDCEDDAVIEIPNANQYEGIYFTLIEPITNPVKFIGGAWCTDKQPQRDGKLAIVSCTYKRENYVSKNIRKFEEYKKENPQLQDKIYMFITDNGKTLPETLNSENVTIYPNMNSGGAGGFTRGVIEVMRLKQNYTRVIFMDDDVEIFPESFYRTLMLSNYLKKEFEESIIHGAMLDLYQKNMFFENLAIQNMDWVSQYHEPQDVGEYDNILSINKIPVELFNNREKKVSSAWWYCSFTIKTFEEKGLPLPLFFRCDDIEYSWRNLEKHHISMNGICVWHAPFMWRTLSSVNEYLQKRNYNFINMLYDDKYKLKFLKLLKRNFKDFINQYNYAYCEVFLKMMRDLLDGAKSFYRNPEELFNDIRNYGSNIQYFKCPIEELNYVKNKITKVKPIRRIIYMLTNRGKYSPDFLFKRQQVCLEWFPPRAPFIMTKEVKVYNLLSERYSIRKYDRKKCKELKNEFDKLYKLMVKKYDNIRDEMRKAEKEFHTLAFWEKYLGLSDEKDKL